MFRTLEDESRLRPLEPTRSDPSDNASDIEDEMVTPTPVPDRETSPALQACYPYDDPPATGQSCEHKEQEGCDLADVPVSDPVRPLSRQHKGDKPHGRQPDATLIQASAAPARDCTHANHNAQIYKRRPRRKWTSPQQNCDKHLATRAAQCGEGGDTAARAASNAALEGLHSPKGTGQTDNQPVVAVAAHNTQHGPGRLEDTRLKHGSSTATQADAAMRAVRVLSSEGGVRETKNPHDSSACRHATVHEPAYGDCPTSNKWSALPKARLHT